MTMGAVVQQRHHRAADYVVYEENHDSQLDYDGTPVRYSPNVHEFKTIKHEIYSQLSNIRTGYVLL